jgi:hypothetical protein
VSRRGWILVLVVAGVAAAVIIGVIATQKDEESKTEAVSSLCASLGTLESSVQALTSLPSTASKDEYEADVTAVDNAWDQVKTDLQDVQDAPSGDLDSAWDDFTSTVKNVPNDSSVSDAVSDITQSAQALVSAAQTTASEVDCSSS